LKRKNKNNPCFDSLDSKHIQEIITKINSAKNRVNLFHPEKIIPCHPMISYLVVLCRRVLPISSAILFISSGSK
jgi:hypothetical protein